MTVRSRFAKLALLAGFLAVNVSYSRAVPNASVAMPDAFVPEQVFAGRSMGVGTLRLLLGEKRSFTVASLGTVQSNGRMRLAQDVTFEGKDVQSRSWVIWQTGPGRYAGTLTEAAGPVVGRVEGNRLTLRYPLKRWGLVMHQTLDLASDHKTLINSGKIRFLGIPVGELRETIRLKQ